MVRCQGEEYTNIWIKLSSIGKCSIIILKMNLNFPITPPVFVASMQNFDLQVCAHSKLARVQHEALG